MNYKTKTIRYFYYLHLLGIKRASENDEDNFYMTTENQSINNRSS